MVTLYRCLDVDVAVNAETRRAYYRRPGTALWVRVRGYGFARDASGALTGRWVWAGDAADVIYGPPAADVAELEDADLPQPTESIAPHALNELVAWRHLVRHRSGYRLLYDPVPEDLDSRQAAGLLNYSAPSAALRTADARTHRKLPFARWSSDSLTRRKSRHSYASSTSTRSVCLA